MANQQIWKKWLGTLVTVCASLAGAASGWGHPPHAHHQEEHDSPVVESPSRVRPAPRISAAEVLTSQPPHGGQMTFAGLYLIEVVYLPSETRVYLFDSDGNPLSSTGVRGGAQMEVRGNRQLYRYGFEYVRPPAPLTDQDFLVAKVDVTQIRDGDMRVTIDLDRLPTRQEPWARIVQIFSMSHLAPAVTVVEFTDADRDAAARQGICPVMNTAFEHGQPIKLVVGDRPLFVCCEDCIQAVTDAPERFLRPMAAKVQKTAVPPAARGIVVAQATSEDARAVQMQGDCPVMGQPLGGHGTPLKVTIGDDVLFVCCKGCLRKVESDPDRYLAKAAESRNRQ
jgi:hypothetical protein